MCQDGTETARLIENPNLTWDYCDGIAHVEVVGVTVIITYFVYRTIDGEKVRVPSLEMRRPLQSCLNYPLRDLTLQAIAAGGTTHAAIVSEKTH